MKKRSTEILDSVDWCMPVNKTSYNELFDHLMMVFKYYCNLHPREKLKTKLFPIIKDSKIDRVGFYDEERVLELLSFYLKSHPQFSLEMIVGDWYLIYNPKIKPSLNPNKPIHKVKPKRSPIPGALRHEVFKRDGYKCVECGATNQEVRLHVDHIIPISQGGSNELDNLQTLCIDCNLAKSNRAWKGGIQD